MIKNTFLMLYITNIMFINSLFACPCGFSSEDKRPFFEQYEIENNTTQQEKKEKS